MVVNQSIVETIALPLASRRPIEIVADDRVATDRDELRQLLHKRLRFLGTLGSFVYGLFTTFLLVPLVVTRDQPVAGYPSLILISTTLLLVFAGLTATIWSYPALSIRQLRAIEVVVFALVLAHITLARTYDMTHYDLSKIMGEGPPTSPPRYATFYAAPFFALMVAYGITIPNTGWRASAVISVIGCLPIVVVCAVAGSNSMLGFPYIRAMVAPLSITMVVGVALSIYGSHRINFLREESNAARQFGQYKVGKRLGKGGMGEVYLAQHALIRRPCVIKLIQPELAGTQEVVRRFEREVQATAALTNWHSVQIFDYGYATDGTFYYVMEYLPGQSLDQLVRQHGPLPASLVIHVLRQICSALAEAHVKGLIHRDVKPGNIMLGAYGGLNDVAKLLDFGLVTGEGVPSDMRTQEVAIAGTPAYMSPEQAAGSNRLDGRSDLYSLGAVGFFLLTGQPPFVRETTTLTIAAILSEPVIPLSSLNSTIPSDLQDVLLKCLQKDVADRFQEAGELSAALARCKAYVERDRRASAQD